MGENLLSKINNIPVRTWAWLGVNDISIDSSMPGMKPYILDLLKIKNNNLLDIEPIDKMNHSLNILNSFEYDGISKELLELARDHYNTGFFSNTKRNQKIEEPIIINYKFDRENNVIYDNNVIIAEENSEITFIIKYDSKEDIEAFHNGLTRIYCKKNATVNLVKVQSLPNKSTHLDACITKLEENAKVNFILVELGAKNSVTNVCSNLEGFRSSVNIQTVYWGDKERILDMNYLVNHYGKETKSKIEAKGALMDKSNKILKGTIDFKKGASKACGTEEEYAVLLSKEVRNRSVPILLCTEDDVSGQHAASAGKIDENKLFYLMTRGLSEEEAKKLIIEAAISPIIDQIPDDNIKTAIYEEIRRKLI